MPYLTGVLTGILLTIAVLFLVDHVGSQSGPRLVNWDVLGAKLGQSAEEVRQEVHEATAPPADGVAEPPPGAPQPSNQ
jgi:hypothetical protein